MEGEALRLEEKEPELIMGQDGDQDMVGGMIGDLNYGEDVQLGGDPGLEMFPDFS